MTYNCCKMTWWFNNYNLKHFARNQVLNLHPIILSLYAIIHQLSTTTASNTSVIIARKTHLTVALYIYIWYSSSLTLHSHVKTHGLSPAFCMELLNISQVINFYLKFWCARACLSSRNVCTCVHKHTLHEYTQNCTSTLTC